MARIYLHIGYPKTGTTSLQTFFTDNRDALREHGWLYPQTGIRSNAHYDLNSSLDIGHHGVEQVEDSAVLKRTLDQEIASSGCENVIISSEAFITAGSLEPVRDFFSSHELRVIVYLRRHDLALESAYAQAVKTVALPPWGPGIESFILYNMGISTIPWDYLATLRKWESCVEREHLIVRPFESDKSKPDLYADFLNAIGFNGGEDLPRPEHDKNPRAPYRTLAVIDMAQRAKIDTEVRRRVVGALMRTAPKPENEPRALLSPHLRNAITTKYRASYAIIAKEFLDRQDGVLFQEPETRPHEPWDAPRPLTSQEVANTLLRAFDVAAKT